MPENFLHNNPIKESEEGSERESKIKELFERIKNYISQGWWNGVRYDIETAEKYGIPQSELHLDQCTELFSQKIKEHISQGSWDSVQEGIKTAEKCSIPMSEFDLTELFSQKIKDNIPQGWWSSVRQGIETAEECGIPQSELHLDQCTELFSQKIKKHISQGSWDSVQEGIETAEKCGIPQSELHLTEAFSQGIKEYISQGWWSSVRQGIKTAEKCGIPQSELHLTEAFSQGIKERFSKALWDGVQQGIETAEEYGISQLELHLDQCVEAFSQGIKENVSQGWWPGVRQGIETAEECGVPQSELYLTEIFSQGIKEHISQGWWNGVRYDIETAEKYGIPQSELHLTEAFSQGIKEHISNSRWDDVKQGIALLKKYSPSGYTAEEFLREPSIRQSLLEIENLIPRLSSKMTIELFLDFITLSEEEKQSFVQTLLDNPFLAEAMVENKYGAKLIFKYPELDDLSKENITLLYEVKKERGELDPHSTEFRRAVQDRLLTYRNNQSIKTALEEDRVDVKTWLEYDERAFFDLGRDQETSSVEKLRIVFEKSRSQSFDRSVRDYLGRIVSIIHTQFKKDFQGKTLSEEVSPFEEELRTKQDVYEETKRLLDEETSKNEELQNQETLNNLYRRKIGIEKQILSLEEKIKHPKAVPAYDRVRGDVVLVDKALEKFSTSLKKMFTLDERLRNLQSETKEEQRKQIKELKKEQLEQERISQQAFELFYSRMKVLEERLGETFGNILGEEQKELFFSLLHKQEEDQFSEERDHMSSDMRTIQSLLEDQFRKKDSLEGTPMSVGLWDRNPDEDLYLGNYTDCCIRIDSEHMGEESTIADYLTDVGIQVLVVRDEKRDIPAVATWLWIGKDEKTQEVALVVDNIEANTEYSLSYEEQLKEQLRTYLGEYARNIGIEKIVQGKYNNDITLFGKGGSYKKLGGYNREDGYFLEAEK